MGDGTFENPATYRSGEYSSSVTTGDFNSDGVTDLAMTVFSEYYSSGASVILGVGDGTFVAQKSYPEGGWPYSITPGDFNGDGVTDLATAIVIDDNVSVRLGVGDGTFGAETTFATGENLDSVTTGDFNGDGIADLATSGSDGSVLLGVGDGSFAPYTTFEGGGRSVTTGDFNGDGVTDLVTAGFNIVLVLLGVGDGTFAAPASYAAGDQTECVTTGDFNGDGVSDLATANRYSDNVSVLLGQGDGTFAPQVSYPTAASPWSVTTGDFNGDGITDLATTNFREYSYFSRVSVLLGVGDGTFSNLVTYSIGRVGSRSVTTGDFNGDGATDLVLANLDFSVSVLPGVGDGTFSAPEHYAAGRGSRSVATGDFNGDGLTDLATASFSRDISVLLNQCTVDGIGICASNGVLVEGAGESGDFNAACGSDDSYWAAHGATFAFAIADPVVQFELTALAPVGFSGGTLSVDIEASKQSSNANLNLRALMFDFTTGSYVSLPGVMPLTTSDQVRNFELPAGSDPNDFIEPGTDEVRLLLQTIQTSGLPNVRTQVDEVLFNFD